MQKISRSLFQKSVFNIGAGKDLNPLIRFAHYSDTFIFTNLFLNFGEINSWYKNQFKFHSDFELLSTEIVEERAYLEVFEQGANEGLYVRPVYPFDNNFFMENYSHVFHPTRHDANWLIYFEVKFKPLNKILRLFYYNGEGLATYLRLSNSGQYSCRILVTIQTGVLEFPNREVDQFYSRYKAPLVWVRGYEPSWEPNGQQLAETGYFEKVGTNFNHYWSVGEYNPGSFSLRLCKGFITKDTWEALDQRPNLIQWSSLHSMVRSRLETSPLLKDGDIIVLPHRLSRLQKSIPAKVNLIYWESLVGLKVHNGSEEACCSGAKEQILALRKKLDGIKLQDDQRIHLIPFCLESEMEVYQKEVLNLPFKTTTYGLHPLDFTTWEDFENTISSSTKIGKNQSPSFMNSLEEH